MTPANSESTEESSAHSKSRRGMLVELREGMFHGCVSPAGCAHTSPLQMGRGTVVCSQSVSRGGWVRVPPGRKSTHVA